MKSVIHLAAFIFLLLVLYAVFIVFTADAEEIPKDFSTIYLSLQSDDTPLKIVTRNNTIYVWPCGKVAKESIEILNENEDWLDRTDWRLSPDFNSMDSLDRMRQEYETYMNSIISDMGEKK